ncbi:lipase member H-like [Anthonomus grandis grandis]|uniref:lipase member H-like n=1 Tax=Anthonomus grandis grandis TaxID=2921223 RepID=UPI0021652F03|nr:lipase member H-like [Anthonomus grandis grandis]
MVPLVIFVLVTLLLQLTSTQNETEELLYQHQMQNRLRRTINIGPCRIVLYSECPDPEVTFFMYSTAHPESPEQVYTSTNLRGTNLQKTSFDPRKPTKVIIHGYNSNMFLSALTELRQEYLKTNDYNIFAVDWSPLNKSPCYPAAVWNSRHVGTCVAQLIDRIRDMGAENIHVIGFSLGAHITNYLSIALRPYKLPRITGLDPALPGFITGNLDEKLDKSDATFVDVYHTNALMQGKAEESGHVDFYFNGGSVQPGCWGPEFFSCNHHRAPLYYAESINSDAGFWGWKCPSYFDYLGGRCPPSVSNELYVLAGEKLRHGIVGTYMVITGSSPPFAIGPYNFTTGAWLKGQKPVEDTLDNSIGTDQEYQQPDFEVDVVEPDELFNQLLEQKVENERLYNNVFGGAIYDNLV